MTHLRMWKFEVGPEAQEQFVAAYKPDGDWARLFAKAPGFIRCELWRGDDGTYLTADYWESVGDFERFQAAQGEEYQRLDAELEDVAGIETFIGAFDVVD